MRDFSWAVRTDEEEGSAMTSSGLGVALGESVFKRLVDRVGWKRSSRVLFLGAALEPIASLLAMANKEWPLAIIICCFCELAPKLLWDWRENYRNRKWQRSQPFLVTSF